MNLFLLIVLYFTLIYSFYKFGQWKERYKNKKVEQEKVWKTLSGK